MFELIVFEIRRRDSLVYVSPLLRQDTRVSLSKLLATLDLDLL